MSKVRRTSPKGFNAAVAGERLNTLVAQTRLDALVAENEALAAENERLRSETVEGIAMPSHAVCVALSRYFELTWKGYPPEIPAELVDDEGTLWTATRDPQARTVRVMAKRHFYGTDESQKSTEYVEFDVAAFEEIRMRGRVVPVAEMRERSEVRALDDSRRFAKVGE